METQSYRIDNTGRFFKETLYSEEIEVTEAVAKAFQTGMMVTFHNVDVIQMPDGARYPVHVKYDNSNNLAYWSVQLTQLTLNTAFRTVGEGDDKYLTPKFVYGADDTVLSIPWVVPLDAEDYQPQLILVVCVDNSNLKSQKQYLFAFDHKKACYRLPVSNLYATCELCCGEFDRYGASHIDCVGKAVEQFRKAQWNADLYQPEEMKQSEKFFRLKPLKEGFQTLPIQGNWTKLCQKVSTPTVQLAVL